MSISDTSNVSDGLTSHHEMASAAILLGDSVHSFPPDLGQVLLLLDDSLISYGFIYSTILLPSYVYVDDSF